MADVVSINGEKVYAGEPHPDVVKELADWLERARAGEVVGVGIIACYRDDATGSRRAGRVTRSMVGQAFSLAHRMTTLLEE